MVSVYGYITVANLEAFADDYSAILASYSDTKIEAQISQAERMVNVYCNQSFSGTIPDGVISVTLEISFRLMYNKMLNDGQLEDKAVEKRTIIKKDSGLKELLDTYIFKNLEADGIDIIPTFRPQNYRV